MRNPLQDPTPSPLMRELVKRKMKDKTKKQVVPKLAQPVPKLRTPVQRAKQVNLKRGKLALQRLS